MTGLLFIVAGWLAFVVGLVLLFGFVVLIPAGAVTCAAGFLLDWEEVIGGKRP